LLGTDYRFGENWRLHSPPKKVMCRFALASLLLIFALMRPAPAQENVNLEIGGGRIEVAFLQTSSPKFRKLLLDWVDHAARAVANYYQRFPVNDVYLRIDSFAGRGVHHGHTVGDNVPRISIAVGNASTAADFAGDWMLTHEMIHLAFPSMPERNHWIEEGLATYVEPVARARVGQLTVEQVWSDWVRDMPQGLPKEGDRGLDFTPTWGRTYWGGALFCLLAEVEIRERTENKRGLQDALRAILGAGNICDDWPIERALRIGDTATGVPVLQELYQKMKAAPVPVDLADLWKRLGIQNEDGRINFNNTAPLAAIRRAIIQLRE
jgi:hypothetical protein